MKPAPPESSDALPRIRDGVFFTRPADLPRGRHPLGRDKVHVAQRERLMIAATELLAARGFGRAGVRDICERAQTSQSAFYAVFANRSDCESAAYDRFIEVLQRRLADTIGTAATWNGTVHAVISAYLSILELDLVVARAFQVEMDAAGRSARARRRESLIVIAQVLKAERDRRWPGHEVVLEPAYLAVVYAVRQLASDLLDTETEPDFDQLATEVTPWVMAVLSS